MTLLVFAGPSLPAAAIRARLDCVILPPAAQGDVWRAIRRHGPRAIGLIDGVFRGARAVWHRELLWALSEGIHVLGAASMGALRAAELHPFGMAGVGQVFAAYRAGLWPGFDDPFEDDDEVAVEHAPPELGHAPLSTAMVDLRCTLLAAEAAGAISRAERLVHAAALKALPYPQRHLPSWLAPHAVHAKRDDALALLGALAPLATAAPFKAAFRFERTLLWTRFVSESETMQPEFDLHRALNAFRLARGLTRREDLERWMIQEGLDEAGLVRLLRAGP